MTTFSTDFVLAETKKLQYLYRLKYEIRYDLSRNSLDFTESVAEHVYGMQVLAAYFGAFEDPERAWNWERIQLMITWHDIDEIETGDMLGYKKSAADRAREADAARRVIEQAPQSLQALLSSVLTEYEARESIEAKFVKALDKLEPLIHLYNERGKDLLHHNKTTLEESESVKRPYVNAFSSTKAFTDILHEVMVKEGYFYTTAS